MQVKRSQAKSNEFHIKLASQFNFILSTIDCINPTKILIQKGVEKVHLI
jgi:hypothetical protein